MFELMRMNELKHLTLEDSVENQRYCGILVTNASHPIIAAWGSLNILSVMSANFSMRSRIFYPHCRKLKTSHPTKTVVCKGYRCWNPILNLQKAVNISKYQ